MKKMNVLVFGRMASNSISSHTKSFLDMFSYLGDKVNVFLGVTSGEEDLIEDFQKKYGFSLHSETAEDFFYDIGFFVDVFAHDDDYANYLEKFPFKACFLKFCYPVFDGSIPPKDWIDIVNYNFDSLLCSSNFLVESFVKNGVVKPVFNFGYPVEREGFLASQPTLDNKKFRFGAIGALESRKNITKVVSAFDLAFKGNDDVELYVHSSYSMEDDYKSDFYRQLNKLNNPNIHFSSQTLSENEKNSLFKSFNSVVHVSMAEGYSIVPREALFLGLPIIISNIPVHVETMFGFSGEEEGIFWVDANVPLKICHFSLGKRFLGVQYDCEVNDIKSQMIKLYENRFSLYEDSKIAKRKKQSLNFTRKGLRQKYENLINPLKIVKSQFNEINNEAVFTDDIELITKYELLAYKKEVKNELTKAQRYVLQASDKNFSSLFSQFLAHLGAKKNIIPDWRLVSLMRTINAEKPYHEKLELKNFLYISASEGNLWLRLFEKLPIAQCDYIYNTDLLYREARIIDVSDEKVPNGINHKNLQKIRKTASNAIVRNVNLKRHLLDIIEEFINDNLQKDEIMFAVSLDSMINLGNNDKFEGFIMRLEQVIKNSAHLDFKVFISYGSQYLIEKLEKRFAGRLIYYVNSANEIARTAEEEVVEIYTMARAKYLICDKNNAAFAASLINADIKLEIYE
jgi:glycosyltransferase involved in cell wall biosynthesis